MSSNYDPAVAILRVEMLGVPITEQVREILQEERLVTEEIDYVFGATKQLVAWAIKKGHLKEGRRRGGQGQMAISTMDVIAWREQEPDYPHGWKLKQELGLPTHVPPQVGRGRSKRTNVAAPDEHKVEHLAEFAQEAGLTVEEMRERSRELLRRRLEEE